MHEVKGIKQIIGAKNSLKFMNWFLATSSVKFEAGWRWLIKRPYLTIFEFFRNFCLVIIEVNLARQCGQLLFFWNHGIKYFRPSMDTRKTEFVITLVKPGLENYRVFTFWYRVMQIEHFSFWASWFYWFYFIWIWFQITSLAFFD